MDHIFPIYIQCCSSHVALLILDASMSFSLSRVKNMDQYIGKPLIGDEGQRKLLILTPSYMLGRVDF